MYGAKRTLDRPRQGSPDDALWGAPRAETAAPLSPRPSNGQSMSLGQYGGLQIAERNPLIQVGTHFGLILGPFAI